jgi:hypothetical protein
VKHRAGAALVVALVLALPSCGDDDDGAATTTTPTTAPVTTTVPATTTTALSTTDRAFVVWPFPDSRIRYDDPVVAAREFAEQLVGFTDPVVGPFQEGDARSGEVPVRPRQDGPVTTVLVRRLGADDAWWVLGSVTEDIAVAEPAPQQAIDNPLQANGESRAFEGTVEVAVYADGSTTPLGTGYVTGGAGPELGAFAGSIPFRSPHGGWGSVVFSTRSAEDGRVWNAATVRVGFIGGD